MAKYLRVLFKSSEKVALERMAQQDSSSMGSVLRRLLRKEAQRRGIPLVETEHEQQPEEVLL